MIVSLITAYAKNMVIGNKGKIPWHIPEDFKRFKRLTLNHTIIMGRKTFESFPKALPKRRNVVLTRDLNFPDTMGADVVYSLNFAIKKAEERGEEKVFIIGGGEIYAQALDIADELIITNVDQEPEGDAYFPKWDVWSFKEVFREEHDGYRFVDYKRVDK